MPRVRTLYILTLCNHLPDTLPAPADRSLAKHREAIRCALIALFEDPIPAAAGESRELLSAVLGNPDLDFSKPIFDLVNNVHLSPLVLRGSSPCVWEDKDLYEKGSRSVLTIAPHATPGQETFFDFLGMSCTYTVCTLYVGNIVILRRKYVPHRW